MSGTCERAQEWLEAGRSEARDDIASHVAACPECRAFEEDLRASREAFRSMPRPACPDHVVARILEAVDALPVPVPAYAPRGRNRLALWWAAAPAVAALALVVWFARVPLPESPVVATPVGAADGTYTEEEIALATEEARVAFTLLSRAMKSTATVVGDEVRHRLTTPIVEGMEQTWDRMPAPFDRPPKDGASNEPTVGPEHA